MCDNGEPVSLEILCDECGDSLDSRPGLLQSLLAVALGFGSCLDGGMVDRGCRETGASTYQVSSPLSPIRYRARTIRYRDCIKRAS